MNGECDALALPAFVVEVVRVDAPLTILDAEDTEIIDHEAILWVREDGADDVALAPDVLLEDHLIAPDDVLDEDLMGVHNFTPDAMTVTV
jgi:hypothetical protein